MPKISSLPAATTLTGAEQFAAVQGGQTRRATAAQIVAGKISMTDLLLTWAQTQNFQLVSGTRDDNGALTSASIVWPDGAAGVFTADVISEDFPGAVDAWHATYAGTPARTVTQPAVTRDANGAVTVQPAITIS